MEVLLSPLQLIGSLVFAFRVRFVNMPRGISGTAYEPYMARPVLHMIGSRHDEVAIIAAAVAADSPIRQFVVLGAGRDTRSYGPLPEGADVGGSGVKIPLGRRDDVRR